MPYESLKAQRALKTALSYERLPGSEFVTEMAKILKEADEEIRGFNEKLRLAETETMRSQRDADQLRQDYKLLRESAAKNYEGLLLAMKDIATSNKGGKAKAVAALTAIGVELPPTQKPAPSAG